MLCPGIAKTIIQNFEPDLALSWKFRVFILFCEMTSGGKNLWVVTKVMQHYVIVAVDLNYPILQFLKKIDGFEKI